MLALSMTIAIIVAKNSVTQKPIVESLQNDNDGRGDTMSEHTVVPPDVEGTSMP
jgi:hypothetical protein